LILVPAVAIRPLAFAPLPGTLAGDMDEVIVLIIPIPKHELVK
jgi:hypothetical protein